MGTTRILARGIRMGSTRRLVGAALVSLLIVTSIVAHEVQPVTAAPQQVQWVALGDSYSAGVGLGSVGTECDRDDGAYAPSAKTALNSQEQVLVTSFSHVACSGAVSGDYWVSQHPGVAPQRNAITPATNLVTLTFGGNDISFPDKIYGCLLGDCGPDVYELSAGNSGSSTACIWSLPCSVGSSLTWDALYERLVSVYVDARTQMSTTGQLFVLSYPVPFALSGSTGASCSSFEYQEQLAANALATRLGDTISLAAAEARRQKGNVTFVDWRTGSRVNDLYAIPQGYAGAGQKFPVMVPPDGLCDPSGAAQINGVTSPVRNSFHPNIYGYGFAASKLRGEVARTFPATPDPAPSDYSGHIVQWSGDTAAQKTSWVVSADLKRYWIPDIGTFNCLKNMGYPGPDNLSSGMLDQLPDMSGQGATCGGDSLGTNRVMLRNTYIQSNDGRYILRLQGDGNLVMYGPQGVTWANYKTSDFLIMQPDGNLVTYAYGRGATWWSGTTGRGANRLTIQNDGNLVLYAPDWPAWTYNRGVLPIPADFAHRIVQWDGDTQAQKTSWVVSPQLKRYWIPDGGTYNCLKGTGFADAGAQPSYMLNQMPDQSGQHATCGGDWLGTNRVMLRDTYIRSNDGRYILWLQGDGNLVMYGPQGQVVWANYRTSDFLIMQSDGNLVTYSYAQGATWWSGTGGTGANVLVIQNDGNLVLYKPGAAVWTYRGRL